MAIDSIRVSLLSYQRVVILKQKNGDRYLPIWVGPAEADAIAVRLQDVAVPRPLTHDLLHSVLSELGAAIDHIVVSGLDHETFFAKILLSVGERNIPIDSRPSDALAMAVRAKVPIFADETVLDKAGVQLDKEGGVIVGSDEAKAGLEATKPVDDMELKTLSAFHDFVESLDIDDIGEATKRAEDLDKS